MAQAQTMNRWGWLLVSVAAASACVLPDYDHGRGPRNPPRAGNAGSASESRAAAGSSVRAIGGNANNSGGAAGTAVDAIGAGSNSRSAFGSAGEGGTAASSLATPVGGALGGSGAITGTLSSLIVLGGAASTSVNTESTPIQGGTASGSTASGGTATGGTALGGTTSILAAGAPSTGGIGGAGGSNTLPCPSGRGPDMVRVPEGYCIDKTEVTEGQYAAWIATSPAATPASQRAECAWNNNFESNSLREVANYPVTAIDWCDAVAFCTWANKRLCGAIGGGAQNYYTGSSSNQSQWYNACSAHGTNVYPYGDVVENTSCNAGKAGLDTVAPVGEFDRCTSSVSGYTEIVDMSGNVAEWLDSCNGPEASDVCRTAGGSYIIGVDPDPRCALPAYEFRNNWYYNVGFRCCAE